VDERARKKTPVEDLLDDVESYIEDWFQAKLPFSFSGRVRWTPPTDVYETEDEFAITLAVPGIEPADVRVELDVDTLVVRGVRREACGERRRYHKMEIPVGPFERRIRLGRALRAGDVRVRYDGGLLRIVVPKSPAAAAREIPID